MLVMDGIALFIMVINDINNCLLLVILIHQWIQGWRWPLSETVHLWCPLILDWKSSMVWPYAYPEPGV